MEYTMALGVCPKCGRDKINVEGTTICITCDNQTQGSGLVVTAEDPGHDALENVLKHVGVTQIPGGKPSIPSKPTVEANKLMTVSKNEANGSFEVCISKAIGILKIVPMPNDLKQFKAISKAIKTLEAILGA